MNPSPLEPIRWAARLQPALLKRLYDTDAQGIHDEELCDDVAYRLWLRCQTIVMVACGEVFCPRCGTPFTVNADTPETVTICPKEGCGWQTTRHAYHQSWRKLRIWGHNAITFFEEYYEQYDPKLAYKEKLFLIDRLIHQFHWSAKEQLPARTVANNLLEGSHNQIVQFLDELSGVDPTRKAEWRQVKEVMMRRRRGGA
ncbi:MAG: hypothetical protein V2J07_12120 [Anaerolineae bacterium]|jgi:hypothetical protein|nr:hypothetical protein [Anaerolineae bacterium]